VEGGAPLSIQLLCSNVTASCQYATAFIPSAQLRNKLACTHYTAAPRLNQTSRTSFGHTPFLGFISFMNCTISCRGCPTRKHPLAAHSHKNSRYASDPGGSTGFPIILGDIVAGWTAPLLLGWVGFVGVDVTSAYTVSDKHGHTIEYERTYQHRQLP
jgi:hypothetical protein